MDFIDDRRNTIRSFIDTMNVPTTRQKQADRVTDRQTDRQGNNGKQFRDIK